jgi:integrase
MSTTIPAIPPLLHLKSRGLARVRIGRNRFLYLGRWGSEEARDNYAAVVADILAGREPTKPQPGRSRPVSPYTVGELASDYQRHADGYFLKNGRPTSRTYVVRAALKFLEPFAGIAVERFGAADLRLIRERIVSSTIGSKGAKRHPSRITVNEYCRIIAGAFAWAANELPSEAARQAATIAATSLAIVKPLQRGRSLATERPPVAAVTLADINATLPHLSPVVAALVKVQLYSAMRPGEVCAMRVMDLERSGHVWLYRPASHKTEHHGKSRTIALGPKCRAVIEPFLVGREPAEHLFQPGRQPLVPPHERRFREGSYCQAIRRACEAAGVVTWKPNQLRHRAATELRAEHGIEAASIALGHSGLATTLIYAESSTTKLVEIAAVSG